VVARQLHLVRHGEVHNPDGILYGRLPGFHLSELGRRMAERAADDLVARQRPMTALFASPLQRTQESAAPIAAAFDLPIQTDARLIEPTNQFEGSIMRRALRDPRNWHRMVNPMRPSWGEPYRLIAGRMQAAMTNAFETGGDGDVVLVSHQLSIWTAHLAIAGQRFMHDPRQRRCALSSITTFERTGDVFVEVGYTDPAADLIASARDVGAV
jgi:broad specificity phosphatase PhoE